MGERPAMASISSLILSHNPFRGPLPKSVGKLRELQVLKLVILGCLEYTSGAETVLNLKELKQFDVSSNKLRGRIPPHKAILPVSAFKNNPASMDDVKLY
uniref:Leucine-rich repeat-containing N-terminal plant-type domain-containing protein n=1 Tax=Salix viminalis TaxID=40686 RepID=A0A6N2N3U3_SALVM